MSKIRVTGLEELATVSAALRALGAIVGTETVLGSVGGEYAYEIPYEGESDPDDEMWTAPRIVEIPELETMEVTKEMAA